MELLLIRHGETVGQSAVRLYGATDIDLSDLGREQMRRVSRALDGRLFVRLIASPLRRSLESARIIAERQAAEPLIVPEFREIDFGRWEGWTWDEVARRDPAGLAQYQADGADGGFPGGDTRPGFRRRVADGADRVFNAPDGNGRDAAPDLAVLHKGVIKFLLMALLGWSDAEIRAQNIELGSITRLERGAGGWRLVEANLTGHLGNARCPDS